MSSSDDSADSSLRVIVGPTAAGKSQLALALAEEKRGAIISADSRQIYQRFDIGTAKPSAADRARVPHAGIDVAAPDERWSAAMFAGAADEWIRAATHENRVPVIVGGTGFWIASFVQPLAEVPDLDPARRDALDAELDARSTDELREWCRMLDPDIARLGPAQWRRAIQVALLTGRRLSDWHGDAPEPKPRRVRYLVVDPGSVLDERISTRVDEMFAAGWIDEVRALSVSVPHDAIAWKACGYEHLREAAATDAPMADVRDAVIRETRQYARRQRTWFRRQLKHGPVTLLDPASPDVWSRARAWWDGEDDA